MMIRIKRLVGANVVSMLVQGALLGLLLHVGLDAWRAVAISKGASWAVFGAQMLLVK